MLVALLLVPAILAGLVALGAWLKPEWLGGDDSPTETECRALDDKLVAAQIGAQDSAIALRDIFNAENPTAEDNLMAGLLPGSRIGDNFGNPYSARSELPSIEFRKAWARYTRHQIAADRYSQQILSGGCFATLGFTLEREAEFRIEWKHNQDLWDSRAEHGCDTLYGEYIDCYADPDF